MMKSFSEFLNEDSKVLKVNKRMIDNAIDFKAMGYLMMRPMDFLKLTTAGAGQAPRLQQILDDAMTVDEYNSFDIIVHPFIQVDMDSGKVGGHEGRHRVGAVINAGGKEVAIAIVPIKNGYAKRGVEPHELPSTWIGEFNSATVKVNPKKIKVW